jgi:hypothetical protein
MIQAQPKRSSRSRAEPKQPTPVRIASAVAALTVLTVTFDQAVILSGTPKYTTDIAGAEPVSAVMQNPTTLVLTFDAAITGAAEVNIPFNDPAVRSTTGGYVADTLFTL